MEVGGVKEELLFTERVTAGRRTLHVEIVALVEAAAFGPVGVA